MKILTPSFYRACMMASIFILPLSASGQDRPKTDAGWQAATLGISWRGYAIPKDELEKMRPAEVVYSGSIQTSGNVAFVCYNGRPSVSFAVEPTDMMAMMVDPPSSRRMKIKKPKMTVDGENIKSEEWIFMPALDVYRARRSAPFKTLYNATLLGSDVRAKIGRIEMPLNLPPADDAFKDFGANCGIGRLADR